MAHPRFYKLAPAQQRAILRAALKEFATYGFAAASLNRIIDAAGISKGSMYYYFEGKEDLYAHLASVELSRLFQEAGPFLIPAENDPDVFWSAMEEYYLTIVSALAAAPQVAAIARDWLTAPGNPVLQGAQKEKEQALLPWFEQALTAGQRSGAVRKDIPMSLLVALVFGLGQAMDAWLLLQQPDERACRKWVQKFIRIIRRVLEP